MTDDQNKRPKSPPSQINETTQGGSLDLDATLPQSQATAPHNPPTAPTNPAPSRPAQAQASDSLDLDATLSVSQTAAPPASPKASAQSAEELTPMDLEATLLAEKAARATLGKGPPGKSSELSSLDVGVTLAPSKDSPPSPVPPPPLHTSGGALDHAPTLTPGDISTAAAPGRGSDGGAVPITGIKDDSNLSGTSPSKRMQAALVAGEHAGGGRFTLIRQLGRGGMGIVWLAKDEVLGEELALKFLPSDIASDDTALEDLRRETRKSRHLTHPNIIRIHDFYGAPGEMAFISMEVVNGPNLSSLRQAQPQRCFDWKFLQPLMLQLCDALQYAHGEKVVHRDLKPANLMLDGNGRLKLADFGIAATVSDSVSRVSLRHATSGTVAYMSPQQMRGEKPRATDDIYALGATLYEMLTSKPPFYIGGGEAVWYQVLHETPQPVLERMAEFDIKNEVPPRVIEVIAACLAKEASQRPQTAAAVADYLDELAHSKYRTLTPSSELRAAVPSAGGPATVTSDSGLLTDPTTPAPEVVPPRTVKTPAAPIAPGPKPTPPQPPPPPGKGGAKLVVAGVVVLLLAGLLWFVFGRRGHEQKTTEQTPASNAAPQTTTTTPTPVKPAPPVPVPNNQNVVKETPTVPTKPPVQNVAPVPEPKVKLASLRVRVEPPDCSLLLIIPGHDPVSYAASAAIEGLQPRTDFQVVVEHKGCFPKTNTFNLKPGEAAEFDFGKLQSTSMLTGDRWTNNLGMIFQRVPDTGVFFSIWDTRVQDYQAFVNTMRRLWPKSFFQQEPTHPAVNVSWQDAQEFCAWLTESDRRAGRLGPQEGYRLPTDSEWSQAAGLNLEYGLSPMVKSSKVKGVYPWGAWPSGQGVANLADASLHARDASMDVIRDYDDGYPYTSPVGVFPANALGLFDMGGNVGQWCGDWYNPAEKKRVVRGSSWSESLEYKSLSSFRNATDPELRVWNIGFRCVVTPELVAP